MDKLDLGRFIVMVVDDSPFARQLLRAVLKSLGISMIDEAGDGQQAISHIKGRAPDLLFADLDMQPVGGLDLTRWVRTSPESPFPFLPIIVISAHTDLATVAAARDSGVTEFLAKPFSARALGARIASIFERPRPFVRASGYFGPDRRRAARNYTGGERRVRAAPLLGMCYKE